MSKNWVGNKTSAFTVIGAVGHSDINRPEYDYYATEPKAVKLLLELESFSNVLEPACGEGHISKVLESYGIKVTSYDLIDRGYGRRKHFYKIKYWDGDIITNPPYKWATEFVYHALHIIPRGRKIAFFLKLQFLESQKRKKLFEKYPPKTVYVSSSRLHCALNGEFDKMHANAIAYCWFVWEKGFKGDTVLKWFN